MQNTSPAAKVIADLLEQGYNIVLTSGNGELEGAMAVIDKDYASAVLAAQIKAKNLLILIDVTNAYFNCNKENQEILGEINFALAMQIANEGHFIKGSMGSKIEASINFVKKPKEKR